MRKSTQILSAVAVAGLVAAGTSAFTASGVTNTAGPGQFVGGTVSQTISGATLAGVAYAFSDAPANNAIHAVTLTFAGNSADGQTPSIVFTATTAEPFTCTAIDGTTHVSTCTADSADQTGAASIAITVG